MYYFYIDSYRIIAYKHICYYVVLLLRYASLHCLSRMTELCRRSINGGDDTHIKRPLVECCL